MFWFFDNFRVNAPLMILRRVLMNRIDKKFHDLKSKKKPAFIPFITAGDPDLQTTKALILEFEKAGC